MKRVVLDCTEEGIAQAVVVDITPGYAVTLLRRVEAVEGSEVLEEFGRLYRDMQADYWRLMDRSGLGELTDDITEGPANEALSSRGHTVISPDSPKMWRGPISTTYGSESMQATEDGVSWFACDATSYQTVMSVQLPRQVIERLAGDRWPTYSKKKEETDE